jgi:hypothetical protein
LGIVVAGLLALPGTAAAEVLGDRWTLLELGRVGEVDGAAIATFRELLRSDLAAAEPDAHFVQSSEDAPCGDAACAAAAGRRLGVARVVYGSVSTLGRKLIVTLEVADVSAGRVVARDRMTIDRVEDLEPAAARLARALSAGVTTAQTAELGNITENESRTPTRREGESGLAVHLARWQPFTGYGDTSGGIEIGLGYWYETGAFAIEPRIGYRFDDGANDFDFHEIPIDVSALAILSKSDIAPYVGGGAGLHWLQASWEVSSRTDGFLVTTSRETVWDSAWAFGVHGRAGVLFFRTYSVRLGLDVQYDLLTTKIAGRTPQGLRLGLGVMF